MQTSQSQHTRATPLTGFYDCELEAELRELPRCFESQENSDADDVTSVMVCKPVENYSEEKSFFQDFTHSEPSSEVAELRETLAQQSQLQE